MDRKFYKTGVCLLLCMKEPGKQYTEVILKYLFECESLKESCSYYTLAFVYNDNDDKILMTSHIDNVVSCNNEILGINYN